MKTCLRGEENTIGCTTLKHLNVIVLNDDEITFFRYYLLEAIFVYLI